MDNKNKLLCHSKSFSPGNNKEKLYKEVSHNIRGDEKSNVSHISLVHSISNSFDSVAQQISSLSNLLFNACNSWQHRQSMSHFSDMQLS